MVPWQYIPSIISALCQLAKLLYDLAREKRGDDMKDCAIELERARASGDVSKLTALIEKIKAGKKCN